MSPSKVICARFRIAHLVLLLHFRDSISYAVPNRVASSAVLNLAVKDLFFVDVVIAVAIRLLVLVYSSVDDSS